MNRKLILIVTFVVLAAMAMLTQKRAAHSATGGDAGPGITILSSQCEELSASLRVERS